MTRDEWLSDKLTKLREIIDAYDKALLEFASDPKKTVILDTGQNRMTVTNQNVVDLQKAYQGFRTEEARLATQLERKGIYKVVSV